MDSKLPLGICKQCLMKLDSALEDINEVREDDEVSNEDKEDFQEMAAYIGQIMALITNKVSKEMDENDFMNETLEMDPLTEDTDEDDINNLLNTEIAEN